MKQLKNYMEQAVEEYLNKWLPSTDICTCETCRLDITALMLNNLKPLYIVTDRGAMFAQMKDFDLQYKADIMTQFSNAVEQVGKNPNH